MHLISSGSGQRHLNEGSMDGGSITLYKNFFFKQDSLDETAEDLVTCEDFPQYGDPYSPLSSDFGYGLRLTSLTLEKLATEEEDVRKRGFFTWVVKATYTDSKSSSDGGDGEYDPNSGQPLTEEEKETVVGKEANRKPKDFSGNAKNSKKAKPWELAPEEVKEDVFTIEKPFRYAYVGDTASKRVVNSAGDQFDMTTTVNGRSFSYKLGRRTTSITNFPTSAGGIVNSSPWRMFGVNYPAGKLLLLPWTYSIFYAYKRKNKKWVLDYSYAEKNIEIRYSPFGWQREVLDVGYRAFFPNEGWNFKYHQWNWDGSDAGLKTFQQDIYEVQYGYKIGAEEDDAVSITLGYALMPLDQADRAMKWKNYWNTQPPNSLSASFPQALSGAFWASYESISSPWPLISGGYASINVREPNTLTFNEYPSMDFASLDLWGADV